MRVLLAGASGLLGPALAQSSVAAGHEVRQLVRHAPSTSREFRWQPAQGELDEAALDGVDAVFCLSGAGVGDHRWTDSYKRVLRESRLQTVGLLASSLARNPGSVRTFVSASAVGYYGDTGDHEVDESSPPGSGFLAALCVDWEAAAAPLIDTEVRAVQLRTGLVLSPRGGLLGRLRPIVALGVGGRLGSGRQFQPWISIEDEIAAMRFVLEHDSIVGPVNLTGPLPVRNQELVATLARLLHRPAVLPVPAPALRLALGEFSSDVVAGQRAVPHALLEAGFTFSHPTLEQALRSVV
jgi:uncharacterized protein (TIGR01777 family)